MSYDTTLAERMRAAVAGMGTTSQKKMIGANRLTPLENGSQP